MAKFDIKKAIAEAKAKGPNMQQAQSGGGERQPPAEGRCYLRLVGYIETGLHPFTYEGKTKLQDNVQLVFEVRGKNYPLSENGNPTRITVKLNKSLNEKAWYFKLFNAMRDGREDITTFAEMLGEGFMGRIVHSKSKDGKVYAGLKDDSGYTITPPYYTDPETEERKAYPIPDPVSELRLFLWDFPSKEMWDSIYIDGEYDDGNTKNVLQKAIIEADNFKGSLIEQILSGVDDLGDEDGPDGTNEVEGASPQPEPQPEKEPTKAEKAAAKRAAAAGKGKPQAEAEDPLAGL